MINTEQNPVVLAHNAISIARTMRHLGRPQRAVVKYDEAIAALPEFIEALDECVEVLESIDDWQGIADRCGTWVALFPDHATHDDADRIHAKRIDALCRLGGIDLAFQVYGLAGVSNTRVAVGTDDVLALIGLRDELTRLPHVLAHHRRLGVDRFLVVDNGSTDGSLEYLAEQQDVTLWRTEASYRGANCGAVWWDLMLRRHSLGNWCLIIDADEYFVFPDWERRSLPELCEELDAHGATCYPAVFLDMYGHGPLSESVIESDCDLLKTFPYFDRNWYRMRRPFAGPRRNVVNHWGGVRSRIFGDRALDSYLLNKIPLFRHRAGDVLLSGNHWTDHPSPEIADGRGALLHFKYDSGFAALIAREVERREHAGAARAHRRIADELEVVVDPRLFDPVHSVRLDSSEQLLRFGIMRPNTTDPRYPVIGEMVHIPQIPAAPGIAEDSRPLWSIVLIDKGNAGNAAIAALLDTPAGEPSCEILLVRTGDSPDASSAHSGAGDHQIRSVTTQQHLTDIEAINLGVSAARGRWVWTYDGATQMIDPAAVRQVIDTADDAVRVVVVTGSDAIGTPAGSPLDLPLELPFDLSVNAIVLRRDHLSDLGGFAPSIAGAAGWEFVQRIVDGDAQRVLVITGARTSATGELSVSMEFGVDIAHRRTAIDLVADRLGLDEITTQRLFDRCATDAASRITEDVERGSLGSALAVLAEILDAPLSDASRRSVVDSLSRRAR